MNDQTSRAEIEELIQHLRTESLYADKATLEIKDLCTAAADALESLQAKYAKLLVQLTESERQRAAAVNEVKRMKRLLRGNGVHVIPSRIPGGRPEWNIGRGPQEAGEVKHGTK